MVEKKGGLKGIEKNLKNIKNAYSFGESGKKLNISLTKIL